MSRVFVHGCGVVSPAGWGVEPFNELLAGRRDVTASRLERPDGRALSVLRVPPPPARFPWMGHPRLRRSSPVSHHTVAAALEALGPTAPQAPGTGILLCVHGGSVQYSRRFFAEALADPSTASPMLFPETVFNAPASHLAAVLGTEARNDTHVGDQSGFLAGLAVAADWLGRGIVGSCLVVSAEEADWTTAEAYRLFSRGRHIAEGSAAILLRTEPGPVELTAITDPLAHSAGRDPERDFRRLQAELGPVDHLATHGFPGRSEGVESRLGDGLGAAGGWTCVSAIEAILKGDAETAAALVCGANLQSLGARFRRVPAGDLPLQAAATR